HSAGGINGNASLLESAQIFDRGCDRKSQFLSFRACSVMDDTPVRKREPATKPFRCQFANSFGEFFRQRLPGLWTCARSSKAANRIDAGSQVDGCRRKLAIFHERSEI